MSKNALQAADVRERSPTSSFFHPYLAQRNPVSDTDPTFELLSPTPALGMTTPCATHPQRQLVIQAVTSLTNFWTWPWPDLLLGQNKLVQNLLVGLLLFSQK